MNHQIMKISPELLEMMGSKLPNSLQPFSREIFLLDIIVAGTSYCKKIDLKSATIIQYTIKGRFMSR